MSFQMSDYHRMEKRALETASNAALDQTRPEYAEIRAAIELLADATLAAVGRERAKLGRHREMQADDL